MSEVYIDEAAQSFWCGSNCLTPLARLVEKVSTVVSEAFNQFSKFIWRGIYTTFLGDGGFSECMKMKDEYKWKPLKGDKRLNEVFLLGSHNAFISKEEGWWLDSQQNWSFHKQLQAGIRCFEVDMEFHGDRFNICHNPSKNFPDLLKIGRYETFKEKMDQLIEWLSHNKDEVVILTLDVKRDRNTTSGRLNEFLKSYESHIYHEKGDWPLISEMRELNKRIVILSPTPSDYSYDYETSLLRTSPSCVYTNKNMRGGVENATGKLFMVQCTPHISNPYYPVFHRMFKWTRLLGELNYEACINTDYKIESLKNLVYKGSFRKTPGMENYFANILLIDDTHKAIRNGVFEWVNHANE